MLVKTYTVKRWYKAFGLVIVSEIPLPELYQLQEEICEDVTVRFAHFIDEWEYFSDPDNYFFIEKNKVLFRVHDVGLFKVINGIEILFQPIGDVEEDHLRLYLLGTCMGAILMQRRILPFHGSAIEIDGKAYAIVGDSGAGKSTTASALLQQGYKLISDDVIPVTLTDENIPMVTPAYPQQKLWQQSIDEFGMESSNYRPIVDRETKFAIPVTEQFSSEPLPLAGIFELVKNDSGHNIEFKPIRNLERLHTLFYHTYRNFFLEPAGLMEWHFKTCAAMVNKLEMHQIKRPSGKFTANEIASQILSTVKKEAVV